ncbi:hypothetical protein AVEN_53160-1 [Araneus ventricosus]|uniref:Uncharacterized protein n=1 Tax=Araneus ventricosus TaxID=182803 RepID=A0A4Y2AAL9_ARAVE|nr:hypothetical protein AVEN_53160-1 [Araneus ventricosus]
MGRNCDYEVNHFDHRNMSSYTITHALYFFSSMGRIESLRGQGPPSKINRSIQMSSRKRSNREPCFSAQAKAEQTKPGRPKLSQQYCVLSRNATPQSRHQGNTMKKSTHG